MVQLKRGMYTLREQDRSANFSRQFLANQLYTPSYVSLESALSYYNMIPEAVFAVTSVSSKKTQRFTNELGQFLYHHIKPSIYGGYVAEQDEFGNTFYIASREKALVDFLYFRARGLKFIDASIFEASFRLQNLNALDAKKLLAITGMFSQKKLLKLVELLIKHEGL